MDVPRRLAPDETLERDVDARRFAPCTPVHDTSPTAYRRRMVVLPSRSARDSSAVVVRRGHDGNGLGRDVDVELLARFRDRREALHNALSLVAAVVVGEIEVDAGFAA